MKTKTALVFGATGLIGKSLVNHLIDEKTYDTIKVFVRHEITIVSPKVQIIKADFNQLNNFRSYIQGDDLFCCLGTTIKKAGTQEAFRKVDFEMVVQLGVIAKENQIKSFSVISSLGADANSSNFYLRVKGEMEHELKKLQLPVLNILRPSLLLGNREEFRLGEIIGKFFARLLSPFFIGKIKKYRPVHANTVARAMVQLAQSTSLLIIAESDQIQKLGSPK